jgi:diacylglycerol kinase family enzyme
MYYYILEAPSSRAVRQSYQKLRDIVTQLSIAGEMVMSSPARTPAELAEMGLSKGYSTIVAVGGDRHVNEIAASIIGRATLGVVPIDASQVLTSIIGVRDLRDAAESLKRRRLSLQDTVLVEPDILLFLDGIISSAKLSKISMILDNKVRAHAYFNQLTIHRSLRLTLESTHTTEGRKVLGLFNVAGDIIRSESSFHAKSVKIITDPILPLYIAGQPVAKGPLQLRLLPDSLKIITKRGTVLE